MNSLFRSALRINSLKSVANPLKNVFNCAKPPISRNIWYACGTRSLNSTFNRSDQLCSCGCGVRGGHTKAQRELVEFLAEEIIAERKAQKGKTIPTELDGFKASLNGAKVTLTKKVDEEEIKITFNVNHSVEEIHSDMDKPDLGELRSRPSFEVELKRDKTTVKILCSYVEPEHEGYNDAFGIDELSIYEGEWHENVYSVSGDDVDVHLYDLILNYLEEKGISNEFVEKMSEYSTIYEHSAYISLLEGLSKYASSK